MQTDIIIFHLYFAPLFFRLRYALSFGFDRYASQGKYFSHRSLFIKGPINGPFKFLLANLPFHFPLILIFLIKSIIGFRI